MFFRKKSNNYRLELLSLHIPKTAGTSFRNILKEVYGEDAVVRWDINNRGVVRLNESIYSDKELPNARVLHGHYVYSDLKKMFDFDENSIHRITWLRHPVKRVISNYFYLESRLHEILKEEQRNLNILSKMQRSLVEYARDEKNRNRQYKFLEGISLGEFDFVGIQEDFELDLKEIALVLNWDKIPKLLYQNKTSAKKKELPKEIIEEIEVLNSLDMELYQNALQMRNKNLSDYV
ncbi:MAG: hypothetical protein EA362_11785 [Saprospirales bacterium]|nr:MAG: hypothetical protein EA362_11785 [Saprospirales bacterium]